MNDVQTVDYRELSAVEAHFCELYVATRNYAYAYRESHDIAATVTNSAHDRLGAKLLSDPAIIKLCKEIIARLELANFTTLQSCFHNWVQIANADPDELIGLRVGACRHCWGEGFRRQWKYTEYIEACDSADREYAFAMANRKPNSLPPVLVYPEVAGGVDYDHTRDPNPECPNCRGEGIERVVARDTSKLSPGARALYGGVKVTKDGIQINMADRVKALEMLTKLTGGLEEPGDKKRDAPLMQMVNIVQNNITDPAEAERAYQKMIAGLS